MPGVEPFAGEIELGTIHGVFGFRGEVKVFLYNPDSDWLRSPRDVILIAPDGRRHPAVLSVRPGAGNRILGRVAGVDSEEGAQALRDYRIVAPTASLPPLEDDEYYVWQLIGADVFTGGVRAGTVRGVQHAGPVDVLEVSDLLGQEQFVPLRREFVERVDIAAKQVFLVAGALEEG